MARNSSHKVKLFIGIAAIAVGATGGGSAADSEALVDTLDDALRLCIEEHLEKGEGETITRQEMTTLERLDCSERGVAHLSGMEYAENLGVLDLEENHISDLSPLARLSLDFLLLGSNQVSDLTPLAGLPLKTLGLDNNQVSDLTPLSYMTSLEYLSVSENQLVDLAPLAGLSSLSSLLLYKNQVSDLTPLAGLPLNGLRLENNQVSDLTPLAGLPLEYLQLDNNQVSDLTPLSHMTSLETLDLRDNEVIDLAPLAGLLRLRFLYLSDNYVSNLAPLAELPRLEHLHVAFCKYCGGVSDLTPLQGMTALKHLALRGNSITDLAPLANLPALEYVSLRDNRVSDLAPLVSNRGIGDGDRLALEDNALSYKSVNSDIPELVGRGVEVSFDVPAPIPDGATVVEFADPVLERAIRSRMQRGEGWPIAASEMETFFSGLALADLGIEDLTGLEFATGLAQLDLSNNRVTDLQPLAGLTSLRGLWLSGNPVSDISPIAGLPVLDSLTLDSTEIEDISPLANARELGSLVLDGNSLQDVSALDGLRLLSLSLADNEISDIGGWANHLGLRWLSLRGNTISSLAQLSALESLRYLDVSVNRVRDLAPLSGLHGLEDLLAGANLVSDLGPLEGERLALVDLSGNPLRGAAISEAKALRRSGVTVLVGHAVPYFPAAGEDREGFVRVINRDDEGGEAVIDAVDDAGERFGPVRLALGPMGVTHLNSEDLERGNATKGLSAGVGAPTKGDWRLELTSPLDIEVLSYIRTRDGFVTAMHDVAPDSMLFFFNPGTNARQRSSLRVVNTEAGAAKLQLGGRDDGGAWRAMPNAVLVRPGHTFTATAQALEEAHGLGDGAGKWRLRVPAWPWLAMSLLESPTGHLSNLSTAPAKVERLADGTARHRVPLLLAAGGSREGFVRVINRSAQAGEVEILATDDAGNLRGPVRLDVPGRKAVHFNSHDLENGNPAKGLSGALGAGTGDWRLAFTTALDVQALAYVRTADGFVTAMHDLAPVAQDGGSRVVFFNPGSNAAQVSKLRLINEGDAMTRATITGIDDRGSPSGTVALTLPPLSARTLTAAQLEAGGGGISGRLGDGAGKWRLRVYSDGPLAVMSLLESPTGHLTNLSTATAKVERNPWPVSAARQRGPSPAQEGLGMGHAVDFGGRGD